MRRALLTSLLVPVVGVLLFGTEITGFDLPHATLLGALILAVAALPTALHLFAAAAGHSLHDLEQDWPGLPGWQRWASSVVALACGLTTGAAVVMLVLAFAHRDLGPTFPLESEASAHPPVLHP